MQDDEVKQTGEQFRATPNPARSGRERYRRIAGDAARIGWPVLAALAVSLYIVAIPDWFTELMTAPDNRSLFRLGISREMYAAYMISLSLVVIVFHLLVATFLFLRRLDDRMALFVAYALVANGALVPLSVINVDKAISPLAWQLLAGIVRFIGLFTSFGMLYLFPNGRFLPLAARWTAVVWGLIALGTAFSPRSAASLTAYPAWLQFLVLFAFGALGVYYQVYRYQYISTQLERQQIKWAALGLGAALIGPFAYASVVYLNPPLQADQAVPNLLYQRIGSQYFAASLVLTMIGQTIVTLYLLLLPLSFGIAVLRYRLWDIDIILRRTLIYSTLTAALTAIYFTTIVILQWAFRDLTESSQLVIVLSTLFSAMLFRPLFRRIQNSIDRSFYRSRYDAERILLGFSALLRTEVELERLEDSLMGVVQATLQPKAGGVWMKDGMNHLNGGHKAEKQQAMVIHQHKRE